MNMQLTTATTRPNPLRRTGEQAQLLFERMGKPLIVRVQEGQPLAVCRPQSAVACGADTAIGLPDVLHLREPAEYLLPGTVGRPVVYHDHLARTPGLGMYGSQCTLEELNAIMGRDDYGNIHRYGIR